MSAPQKLTKKQKKGIAFRERKGKGKDAAHTDNMEDNDVPIMEEQDLVPSDVDQLEMEAVEVEKKKISASKGKAKGNAKDSVLEVDDGAQKTKKRKRDSEEEVNKEDKVAGSDSKRKKGNDTKVAKTEGNTESKQRFILFVGMSLQFFYTGSNPHGTLGNLRYTTSQDAIVAHFAKCGKPHAHVTPPTALKQPVRPSTFCTTAHTKN